MKTTIYLFDKSKFVTRVSMCVLLLAALILSPQESAHAQTAEDALLFSQRLPASGARSIGLAGTGIAGLGDYSDFFTNPAGLGFVKSSQIAGSLNFLSSNNEGVASLSGFGNPIEEEFTDQGLGNFAGIYRAPTSQGSLVLGVAYNQTNTFGRSLFFQGQVTGGSITSVLLPFDDEFEVGEEDGVTFPIFFADLPEIAYLGGAIEFLGENVGTTEPLFYEAVDPATTIQQRSDVFQEGSMNELSFGGAAEAAPGVMLGASLNISFGSYDFESFFDEIDVNNSNSEEDYIVIDGATEFRGFDQVTYVEQFNSELVGVNLRAGISAEAAPGVRLGLTIESPTYYRVDEEFDTSISTFFDNGLSLSYGGQPGDIGRGSFEYDIKTPWRFGGGVGYTISGLTLMGDIELVDWTQLELDASTDQDFFSDLNRSIRNNFKAVVNTSLGAEYRYQDLSLRIGYAMQPDPNDGLVELSDGSLLDLDTDRSYISAGIGYSFSNKFIIDFGWMQETQDDVYLPDFTTYVVNEEVIRNHFKVGISVLF